MKTLTKEELLARFDERIAIFRDLKKHSSALGMGDVVVLLQQMRAEAAQTEVK